MKDHVSMDCSTIPESKCSVKISGTKEEVMRVSMRHATEDHKYPNTSETKEKLASMIN